MKLQYLIAIFLVIFLPLSIVLSIFIDNLVDVVDREAQISQALLNATYDAVKAYQLNTINENYTRSEATEMRDLTASKNTLLNSLQTELFNSGYGKEAVEDFVPAMLFNLYDGYYIYGASNNIAEETEKNEQGDDVDIVDIFGKKTVRFSTKSLKDDTLQKFNISNKRYYTCRYVDDNVTINNDKGIKQYDLTVSYTLDNYIRVYGTYKDNSGKSFFINASGYYDAEATEETFGKETLSEKIEYYDEKNILEDNREHGRYASEPGDQAQTKSLNKFGDNADFYWKGDNLFVGKEKLLNHITSDDIYTNDSDLTNTSRYKEIVEGDLGDGTRLVGIVVQKDSYDLGPITGTAEFQTEDEKMEALITTPTRNSSPEDWNKPYQEGTFNYIIYNGVKYYLDEEHKDVGGNVPQVVTSYEEYDDIKKNVIYYEYYRKGEDGTYLKDYRYIYTGNGESGKDRIYSDGNYIEVSKSNAYGTKVRRDNLSFNKTYTGIPIFRLANNKRQYLNADEANEIARYLDVQDEFGDGNYLDDLCTKENFKDVNASKYYQDNVSNFTNEIKDILKVVNIDSAEPISYNLNYNTILSNGIEIPSKGNNSASHTKNTFSDNEKYIFNLDMVDDSNKKINDPLLESSPFDRHRKDVIIANLEYSLNVAMESFNNLFGTTYIYTLPKISEVDFDNMTDSLNFVVFFQGMAIGGYKYFNDYSLVTDTISKEYIGKQDIFLQFDPTGSRYDELLNTIKDKGHLANCDTLIEEVKKLCPNNDPTGFQDAELESNSWLIGYSAFEYERDYCEVPLSNDRGSPYGFAPTAYYYPQDELKCYDCLVLKNGVMKVKYDDVLSRGKTSTAITELGPLPDPLPGNTTKQEEFAYIIIGRTLRRALARYKQTVNNNTRLEIKPLN